MESKQTPDFPSNVYTEAPKQSSLFYSNEIKKESELKFTPRDMAQLMHERKASQSDTSFVDINQSQQVSTSHDSQSQPSSQPISSPIGQSQHVIKQTNQSQNISTSMTESTNNQSQPNDPDNDINLDDINIQHPVQSDRSHICLVCFKTFRNKPQLTQHELVHNGVRKHVCSYCEKSFKQVCHLNQHMRVHTGERPYRCSMEGCGRSFAQLSNLNHHQKNHEEHVRRDIARQFRCEICDRSYANQNSLSTHIQKLHTNIKGQEGTPHNPVLSPQPTTKKRKKKAGPESDSAKDSSMFEGNQSYLDLSDSDDGLPTQVKTKSRIRPRPSLSVRIGTPPLSAEKLQGQRSSLPMPYARGENRGSPMSDRYQNSPLSTPQQSHGHMSQSELDLEMTCTNVSDSEQNRPSSIHSFHSHQLKQLGQALLEKKLNLSQREIIQTNTVSSGSSNNTGLPLFALSHAHHPSTQTPGAHHRDSPLTLQRGTTQGESRLSQSQISQALNLAESSVQSHLSHLRGSGLIQSSSARGSNIGESPLPSLGHVLHPQSLPQSVTEAPSHITHHYPGSSTQNKPHRISELFNPAFSDHTHSSRNLSQSKYEQGF